MKRLLLVAASCVALSSTSAGASTWVQYDVYGSGDAWGWDYYVSTDYTHSHVQMHGRFFIDLDAPDYGLSSSPLCDINCGAGASDGHLDFVYSNSDWDWGDFWDVELNFAPGSFSTFPTHLPTLVSGRFFSSEYGHWYEQDTDGIIIGARAKIVDRPDAWIFAVVPVPEPTSWALMLTGFGMIGGAMRSRRKPSVSFS